MPKFRTQSRPQWESNPAGKNVRSPFIQSQRSNPLSFRNNLPRKLRGTNWGACPHTMRTTATALRFSVAEYCCPVWARSTHSKLVDTTMNETWRLITGCTRPTATADIYLLSGIAPPVTRCSVHSQKERTKQLTYQRHIIHHHQPVNSRLHSQNRISWMWMSGVTKLDRIRNERIRGTTKEGEISKKVQECRLKRYGHVLRREDECVGKRVMAMEVPGKRRRGRPNRRCLDSIRNDLSER